MGSGQEASTTNEHEPHEREKGTAEVKPRKEQPNTRKGELTEGNEGNEVLPRMGTDSTDGSHFRFSILDFRLGKILNHGWARMNTDIFNREIWEPREREMGRKKGRKLNHGFHGF
jgi:hypothetical protein